jgi:Amt family ammonium transporter
MIAVGAIAERGRLGPMLVFIFIWSTIVYDPIANWTWNVNGWSFKLGGLDFAGGTPVHISSGTAALAISIYLGKRKGYGTDRLAYKPNNTSYVVLGTAMLWFGWFGFNGGSALSANVKAANACIITNLAASVGGLTWMFWVSIAMMFSWHQLTVISRIGASRRSGRQLASAAVPSLVSLRSHLVLVSLVPVSDLPRLGTDLSSDHRCFPAASVLFGVMAGTVCNFATQLKFIFKYDDALDVCTPSPNSVSCH